MKKKRKPFKDITPKPLIDSDGFHSLTGYAQSQLEFVDLFKISGNLTWSRAFVYYDTLPKFFFTKTKKFHQASSSEAKHFPCTIQKHTLEVIIQPARVVDVPEPFYAYPGEREELVARAIRYLATQGGVPLSQWEKSGKSALIRIGFTLHQIVAILRERGHTYNSSEVDEALRILQATSFMIKSTAGKTVFHGNLIASYYADESDGGKGNRRIVTLNDMEATCILHTDYRAINFDRIMTMDDPVARRIYEFLVNNYIGAPKPPATGDSTAKGFELRLSQLIPICGVVPSPEPRKDLKRIRDALDQLSEKGVFHQPYQMAKEFDLDHSGKPGRREFKDVIFTIWLSASEVSDIIKANAEASSFNEQFANMLFDQRKAIRQQAKKRL